MERTGAATVQEAAIDALADRLRREAVGNESATFWPQMVGAWSQLSNSD
jgi:hypothetical protein